MRKGSIYCVIVRPGKYAEARAIEYEWEGGVDEMQYAEWEAMKAVIGTDMAEYAPYPYDKTFRYIVLADEDGMSKNLPQNRTFIGTFIVAGSDQINVHRMLTRVEALEIVAQMNMGMPPRKLEDGNRKT